MKINTIYHTEEEYKKERKKDLSIRRHTKSIIHHPFMKEREMIRAVNAAKLDRLFAKPFVDALSFHKEGINFMTKSRIGSNVLTSSFDNVVMLSDIKTRALISKIDIKDKIKGIGLDNNDNIYIGYKNVVIRQEAGTTSKNLDYKCEKYINNICVDDNLYAATNNKVVVFDLEMRSRKVEFLADNPDVVTHNSSFTYLIGYASSGQNFIADLRTEKVVMSFGLVNKTNEMSFSPSDGYFVATANEDGNGYIHDMRYINTPCNTLRGHVSAVTCIKYNPQGTELCTGSFDQTIRIFKNNERKSREVYYNQRMHNINGIEYSNDGQYVFSGSDDGSIRIWKAEASKKSGPLTRKEKDVRAYGKVFIEKYKNVNEVERISKHRFMPKLLKTQMKQKHDHYEAQVRKGHLK